MKACKGKGKGEGFGCSEEREIQKGHYGLCDECFKGFLLESPYGKDIIKLMSDRARKKIKKDEKEHLKKQREELKSINDYKKELQPILNSIIRFIDYEKGCISCNHGWEGEWTRQKQAGHFFDKHLNSNLRFMVFNIFVQCTVCNDRKSANLNDFRKGITKHYGRDMMDYIDSLPSKYKSHTFTLEQLKNAIKKAREILNDIKKGRDYSRLEVDSLLKLYN